MNAARVLVVFWVVLGVVIWNGFNDLYVSRGAREYGQLRVEAERDRTPAPVMAEVMDRAKRSGRINATIYASLVIAGGLVTIRVASRTKRTP